MEDFNNIMDIDGTAAAPADATTTAAAAAPAATTTAASTAAPADATTTAAAAAAPATPATAPAASTASTATPTYDTTVDTTGGKSIYQAVLYSGKKRGVKPGGTINTILTAQDWYNAVVLFHKIKDKHSFSQAGFLRSPLSGDKFDGNRSQEGSFSAKLKAYKKGELKSSPMKRVCIGRYEDVEVMLVKYIDLRSRNYTFDKCGLSRHILHVKAREYAQKCGHPADEFKASDGWISNVLKRNGIVGVNLHGEASEMNEAEREAIMAAWCTKFWEEIEYHNLEPNCVYNADQTGLYHQKLPSRLYVTATEKNAYAGVKQMKDKTRLTLMVCTSAAGEKCPLAVVGKSKNPLCFKQCRNKQPPMAYTNQKNAWFSREVTIWWINTVFWPWHVEHRGYVLCILLLDNCSAHMISKTSYPDLIMLYFLPPKVTSRHQPADMGMIAALKVGYRVTMLEQLLALFDVEGGFAAAATARAKQKDGCKGLAYGGKATVLDAIEILNSIWKGDNKYARKDSIQRCWRKAAILPLSWDVEINSNLGSNSLSTRDKKISNEQCVELCSLFEAIRTRVKVAAVHEGDSNHLAVFDNSFAYEPKMSEENSIIMASQWVLSEDMQHVIDVEVDEQLELMDDSIAINNDDVDIVGNDVNDDVIVMDDSEIETVTFMQAQEHLRLVQVYIDGAGVGDDCSHQRFLLSAGLRTHNMLKPRSNPTLYKFFPKVNSI